jgi:hypothetical protein
MGYRESVSIFHEIMVMTAFGTAIKLKGKVSKVDHNQNIDHPSPFISKSMPITARP